MPRVKPLVVEQQVDYELTKLSEQVISELAITGIKKKELAELCGITPGALSQQLSSKKITIHTYLAWQLLKSQKAKETYEK